MGKHLTTQHIPQSRKPMNENIFICTLWTSMEPGLLPSESFGSLQQGLSCLSSLQSCPPVVCSVNTCSDFLSKKWTSSLEHKVLSRHRFTSLTCLRLSKGWVSRSCKWCPLLGSYPALQVLPIHKAPSPSLVSKRTFQTASIAPFLLCEPPSPPFTALGRSTDLWWSYPRSCPACPSSPCSGSFLVTYQLHSPLHLSWDAGIIFRFKKKKTKIGSRSKEAFFQRHIDG